MTIEQLAGIALAKGGHERPEAGMCLLEAVSWINGDPFTDHPDCVSPVLGAFGRSLNDVLPDDKRQQLVPFIPRLIGTAGDTAADQVRGLMAADWLIRVYTPAWLRPAGLTEAAAALEGLEQQASWGDVAAAVPVLRDSRRQASAARAAAWDAAWDAVGAAAGAAAWDAAGAAARDAARDAAWDAAGAAAGAAAAGAAARAAARDAARDAAWDAAGAAAGAAAWDAAAWDAAWDAAGAAAGAAAWDAAGAAAGAAARAAAGAAARAAAGDAARDAARDAVNATRDRLQDSAIELFDRMINAGQVTR